jgi:hypothetical protein
MKFELLTEFTCGIYKALTLFCGSGASFLLSTEIPAELGMAKYASALTGWGLAIACIFVLTRTVKHLFEKLEKKDEYIKQLHEMALKKAEDRE